MWASGTYTGIGLNPARISEWWFPGTLPARLQDSPWTNLDLSGTTAADWNRDNAPASSNVRAPISFNESADQALANEQRTVDLCKRSLGTAEIRTFGRVLAAGLLVVKRVAIVVSTKESGWGMMCSFPPRLAVRHDGVAVLVPEIFRQAIEESNDAVGLGGVPGEWFVSHGSSCSFTGCAAERASASLMRQDLPVIRITSARWIKRSIMAPAQVAFGNT